MKRQSFSSHFVTINLGEEVFLMSPVLISGPELEKQVLRVVREGDLHTALHLEKGLGRPLRIHDELEPLAAIALLRGNDEDFRWIVETRGVNFFNEEGARRHLDRCFGENFNPNP